MGDKLLKAYLTVRKPRNFLVLLIIFISVSLSLHWSISYDADFGATNLMLSIEATVAGAVLMVVAEESAERQKIAAIQSEKMLGAVFEMAESQSKTLQGVLLIAEAQRDMLMDHASILRALRDADTRILNALHGGTYEPKMACDPDQLSD